MGHRLHYNRAANRAVLKKNKRDKKRSKRIIKKHQKHRKAGQPAGKHSRRARGRR